MAPTFLIDSDVVINHLRRRISIRAYLGELEPLARYGCSTIVLAEVYAGMRPAEEPATRQLLESLIHFPVTTAVAEKGATLKRDYGKMGRTLTLNDCLIAATALLEQAVLVTANGRDYPMITAKITEPKHLH